MSLSAELTRLRRGSAPRVLRGTDASVLRSAETVVAPLAQAGEDAGEAASLAEAREAARAEGYAEGYAAALASSEAARAHALEAAAQRLAEVAATVAATREALLAEVTEDALELTYELARTIIVDEALLATLPPRSAIARALALAPKGEDLLVRVPPSCALSPADLAAHCDPGRLSIQQDPAIEEGGCVIEAGACRIDAQIGTALERVRKVLAEARGQGPERERRPE